MSIPNYCKKDFLEDHQKGFCIRQLDSQTIQSPSPQPKRATTQKGQLIYKVKECPYCAFKYPKGSSKRKQQTAAFNWNHCPDGFHFKCFRCGASKTLHQYLQENESADLAEHYQWDRFRHGCTGWRQNCKNPDPEQMRAYLSWAFSSVEKPPAFEERREFYRQEQQRQKEENWIKKHGCPYPHRQSE